ncbi:hypothetical protein, partial [Saliphagus sp. LR7]|uniref:hypothetical protein n=1 Tax=Saliphagus sp. LR7 TaxID=2282654 RepID=UPI001E512F04
METRTETGLGQPNAESPDASYAIVAGLYVAILLAPFAVLVFARVTSNGGLLYLGFLAALTVIATVGSSHRSWFLTRFLEKNDRDQRNGFSESNKDGGLTSVRAPSP